MRHFLHALLLTVCMSPLQCATLERLSLDDMIVKSTAIVRAKVTGSYAALSGPILYTHYTLQVSERFKGPAHSGSDVAVPGGKLRGQSQIVAGAPVFQAGGDYVFFLYTDRTGLTHVIGMTQGVFFLDAAGADPTGTRAASRELMLDRAGKPTKDETLRIRLSDLRAHIAGTLAAGGTRR